MAAFVAYLFALAVFIGGAAYGALTMGAPTHWVFVSVAVFSGLGILLAASKIRSKDEIRASHSESFEL